ncbi:polymer-forming cytoskeletal protein [Paenibacillus sp. HN-1]|uniref:bactofilin family protein n=1 Tax=Paenibacillus TaxID=44249 RepID=UPI001CA9D7DE|nr:MULTISPECIES: polymer-forming cytoskeletal protein [Paenibacillus]MBY9081273.1 polymer-forming cytoskeletal protein [Paenibacillus sp. CGMCC 1.18879]MBY9087546.1 polymer-forming cytoskeletal protein [Paenibacillus sinensis]
MWNKTEKGRGPAASDSLLGAGQTLEGKMQCETNLRIDGEFTGEICSGGTVTVGETGRVHADITAEEIIIAGHVFGDVRAKRRLILTSTGCLNGTAAASRLSIMEGGVLSGLVDMETPPSPAGAGGTWERKDIQQETESADHDSFGPNKAAI